jgi:anthranilate phosphoribosyltransferase
VRAGAVRELRFDAADVGLPRATIGDLRGGDAAHNAGVARRVLAGEGGPVRDAVLLNAAAALAAAGAVDIDLDLDNQAPDDVTKQIGSALELAARSIDSGAAAEVLDNWVTASA